MIHLTGHNTGCASEWFLRCWGGIWPSRCCWTPTSSSNQQSQWLGIMVVQQCLESYKSPTLELKCVMSSTSDWDYSRGNVWWFPACLLLMRTPEVWFPFSLFYSAKLLRGITFSVIPTHPLHTLFVSLSWLQQLFSTRGRLKVAHCCMWKLFRQ